MELALEKPRLRGVLHHVGFFVALVAGAWLVALSPGARGPCAVYAVSLAAMLGASAAYHRPTWSPRKRAWMRRVDHAAIFVMIAGTATPLAAGLEPAARWRFLVIMWVGAAVGVLRALVWIQAPKWLVAVLALALGWTSVPFLPQLAHALGGVTLGWVAAGGVAYTLGALAYAFKRPNPWPAHFGYHEVFHALVVLGAAFHFVAVVRAASMAG
ncbi:MAG: hemolysin III family protein [Myxococcota bacterium]